MNSTKAKSPPSPVEELARDWRCVRRVRPLKIGIREDLLSRGAPIKLTIAALEAFTSTREYYLACRAGAARYDIWGKPSGTVTEAEQTHADAMLAILNAIDLCR